MRGSALVSRTSNADRRYWGLNQIAVELENPFGDDPNDLPLPETHVCFVDALEEASPRRGDWGVCSLTGGFRVQSRQYKITLPRHGV